VRLSRSVNRNLWGDDMSLRIRQIVVAARDLTTTVAHFESVLGVQVCYRDPEVGKFGLENALMAIGPESDAQFLEVVSPIQNNTAAGRHIDRHGDSGYMLILQTDDLKRDRARLDRLNVRIVWQANHPDVSAVHLHPKDIGAAIVSIDQPVPPASWRWAGPNWQKHVTREGARRVLEATMAADDPNSMAQRWSEVLGLAAPAEKNGALRIEISGGALNFEKGNPEVDVISGFQIAMTQPQAALATARSRKLRVSDNSVTISGTRFHLTQAN
jgi:hypothetical protein